MPQFAYELRMFDYNVNNSKDEEYKNLQPDYFTKKFLDLGVITSPIWQAIIKSNHYQIYPDDIQGRMIVDPKVQFRLSLGEYVLRCQDKKFGLAKNVEERPIVVAKPDEQMLEQMENSSKFERFKKLLKSDNREKVFNTMMQMMYSSYKIGTDTF